MFAAEMSGSFLAGGPQLVGEIPNIFGHSQSTHPARRYAGLTVVRTGNLTANGARRVGVFPEVYRLENGGLERVRAPETPQRGFEAADLISRPADLLA